MVGKVDGNYLSKTGKGATSGPQIAVVTAPVENRSNSSTQQALEGMRASVLSNVDEKLHKTTATAGKKTEIVNIFRNFLENVLLLVLSF